MNKTFIYLVAFVFAVLIFEPLFATFKSTTTTNPDDVIVIDSATSLIWQGNYVENVISDRADYYCSRLYYAGFSDWRLPTKEELLALYQSKSDFSSKMRRKFWSSYVDSNKHYRYVVDFDFGHVGRDGSSYLIDNQVICVRGPISDSDKRTLLQSTGYKKTGNLQWSKIAPDYTQTPGMKHADAMSYCHDLREGGYNDWHLPTIDELETLISTKNLHSEYNPNYREFGKNQPIYSKMGKTEVLWSSSIKGNSAFYISFTPNGGHIEKALLSKYYNVRCVRSERTNVQSQELANKKENTKTENLQWSNKAPKQMRWDEAKQYCKNLDESGHNDWRLPNIDDLRTLIKTPETISSGKCKISEKAGKLASEDFTKDCGDNINKLGDRGWFWSSSVLSDKSDGAWYVDFDNDAVRSLPTSFGIVNVRCVRSPK